MDNKYKEINLNFEKNKKKQNSTNLSIEIMKKHNILLVSLSLQLLFVLLLMDSCKPEDDMNPADYELYISISADKYPDISPDGNLIAYYHQALESPEPESYPSGLYVMDIGGTNRRMLLRGNHWSPSWSPDSQKLVFTSNGDLQIININGDSLRTFLGIAGLSLYTPDWSIDGKEILFSAPLNLAGGVYVMTPDFIYVRRILSPIENNGMYARWSPDRSKIVYAKGNQSWKSTEIFTIDTTLASEMQLTNDSRADKDPSWSPNGEFIVWSSNMEIYLMNTDGSHHQRLDYGQNPTCSTDGQFIVYCNANHDFTKEVLWKIDINGKNKVQLTF